MALVSPELASTPHFVKVVVEALGTVVCDKYLSLVVSNQEHASCKKPSSNISFLMTVTFYAVDGVCFNTIHPASHVDNITEANWFASSLVAILKIH